MLALVQEPDQFITGIRSKSPGKLLQIRLRKAIFQGNKKRVIFLRFAYGYSQTVC